MFYIFKCFFLEEITKSCNNELYYNKGGKYVNKANYTTRK